MLFLINKKQKEKILDEYYNNLFIVFSIGFIILSIILSISLFPAYLIMHMDKKIVTDKIIPIENTINQYRTKVDEVDVSSINNISIFNIDVKKNTIEIFQEIKNIYRSVPNVKIISINVNSLDKKVTVVADVNNKNTASILVDTLNTSKYKGADLPYSVFNQNKNFTFSQTLNYE